MRMRCWLGLSLLGVSTAARADLELGQALRAIRAQDPSVALPRALRGGQREHLSLVVQHPAGAAPPPSDAVRIVGDWFALSATEERATRLLATRSDLRFYWTPGRRLLLDRADGWTRASSMRKRSGATGRGVVIGVVDTGVDVLHPELRNADGTSRVRWLVDFNRPALGRHPELERDLGCLERPSECAIYSGADIDELTANARVGDEPRDALGHGTHVASLAAGNGRGNGGQYAGIAPEADLVVARMSGAETSSILDSEILRAARFVFERASDLGMPAVLNLSLGSDFGAHDGSSALERALSGMVGSHQPGRAIVVAAGNSAGLYADGSTLPEPLGVHTAVHVPRYSPVRVPLVTTGAWTNPMQAGIYVWIDFRPGDQVAVGLARDGAELINPVESGAGRTFRDGSLETVILNGVGTSGDVLQRGAPSAILIIEGSWPRLARFEIRLTGQGSAALWVQSDGDLDPMRSSGALFPFASKEGTINVPASAPDLIAVGATLNRVDWLDYQGNLITPRRRGSFESAPAGSVASFSSAGPNALGGLKPDLVAPGGNLISAMSSLSDPRRGVASLFSSFGRCPSDNECYVIDDRHAVSSGTSLAAPLVSGAIALLLERDPALTQDGVRALLQAGARPLVGDGLSEQQTGIGALDLEGALDVQLAGASPIERIPSDRSWLKLAASQARPDPAWALHGYLQLKDQSGQVADGFDLGRLNLVVAGGRIGEPLRRIAPGLHRFALRADRGSGGQNLQVEARFDGRLLVSRSLPIAVDRGAAVGAVSPEGGCGLAPVRVGGAGHRTALGLVGCLWLLTRVVGRRHARHKRAR